VCQGTVTIARIAWRKARWLRHAMLATMAGVVLLATSWAL
jgi:hypothetical protein